MVVLAACLLAACLFATGAAAQVRNLFEVLDVRVDETAESSEAARQKAIAAGERKAFDELLERITRADDRAKLKNLSQTEVSALVKDFWIGSEKASTVRYVAVLNFNFRPSAVRDLLRRREIAFTTQPSKPLLIVPVYQSDAAPLLWEEGNPWRAAWSGQQGTDLVPIRLPEGGSDALALSTEQALAGDPGLLAAMAQRYGAGEAVVVVAQVQAPLNPEQPSDLTVTTSRLDRAGKVVSTAQTYQAKPGEDANALLKRGAKETVLNLDAAWKGQVRTQSRPVAVSAVEVPLADLRNWLAVRRRLSGIDVIDGVNLVMVTRDRVRINLVYSSRPEDLINVLQAAGLDLTLGEEVWTLRLASTAAAQRT